MKSSGTSHQGIAERYVLRRKRSEESVELPRAQRLMQRVFFENAEEELAKSFDAAAIIRGIELQAGGHVSGIDKIGGRGKYHVRVTGADGRYVYCVLELRPAVQGVTIDGICTCVLVRRCEHLAAAALTALAPSAAKPRRPGPLQTGGLRLALADWLQSVDPKHAQRRHAPSRTFVAYVLAPQRADLSEMVTIATVPRLDDGRFGVPQYYKPFHLSNNAASYVTVTDQGIGFELSRLGHRREATLEQVAWLQNDLMRRMLATGRTFLADVDGPRLRAGAPRPGRLQWRRDGEGRYDMEIVAEDEHARVMTMLSPWYIDADGACGPIMLENSLEGVLAAITLPKLTREELPFAVDMLAPYVALPAIEGITRISRELSPDVRLRVHLRDVVTAQIAFVYDRVSVSPHSPEAEFRAVVEGRLVVTARNAAMEEHALRALDAWGFCEPVADVSRGVPRLADPPMTLAAERLPEFLSSGVPHLRALGWVVTLDDGLVEGG